MTSPKVEPPKDKWMRRIDIEQCFVGHNFPNTEIVLRIESYIKLQQEALLSKLEAGIEQARIDGMFTEWNGLNLCDIDQVKTTVNKLRLEL